MRYLGAWSFSVIGGLLIGAGLINSMGASASWITGGVIASLLAITWPHVGGPFGKE